MVCFLALVNVAMAQSIEKGSQGKVVQQVQVILISQGYLSDKADGVFGSKTEAAVKAFQKDNKLTVSGVVDDNTLNRLKAIKREATSTPSRFTFGDRGKHVSDVQQRLVSSGFSPGALDGIMGNDTVAAVKRFQKHHDLEQTGLIDDRTFALLQQERGTPTSYKKAITMEATAYTAYDPGNGSYTARGNLLRRGLVSVDPDVIPLGTELYIEGYGYAVADDTGGAIQGHRIDLAMDSRNEALQFGRQDVKVYVL